jgi:hypothetical protein
MLISTASAKVSPFAFASTPMTIPKGTMPSQSGKLATAPRHTPARVKTTGPVISRARRFHRRAPQTRRAGGTPLA